MDCLPCAAGTRIIQRGGEKRLNVAFSRAKHHMAPVGPTLMRLRELEVLEKVATSGKLNVVLGEKGLAERVVNLL